MNQWEERARQGNERKRSLLSFGPNAIGLLVETKRGIFALDPEDGGVSALLLQHGDYSPAELELARSAVSPTGDVLVVGSHIGVHAVALSKGCRSLVAIEANPHTFRFLKFNLLLNDCTNVEAYNVAAGEADGSVEFLLNRENSGGSKRVPQTLHECYVYDQPEKVTVSTAALDALLGDRSFDLILMDIEGSEFYALQGMPKILASSKILAMEFLPHHVRDVANVSIADFVSTLQPYYSCMYIPRHNRLIMQPHIAAALHEMYQANEGHDNLYFVKDCDASWLRRLNATCY